MSGIELVTKDTKIYKTQSTESSRGDRHIEGNFTIIHTHTHTLPSVLSCMTLNKQNSKWIRVVELVGTDDRGECARCLSLAASAPSVHILQSLI